MGIFNNITGSGTNGAFVFKGSIAVAADFPTSAEVQNGWTYTITANVTDNNPAKTNTGQSFKTGDIIAWNGTNWTDITGIEVWIDDGTSVKTINSRDVDLQSKGLKDAVETTPIKLSQFNFGTTTYGSTIVTDINALTKSGFYTCYGAATGAPSTSYSWFVIHQNSNVGTASATQRAIAYNSDANISYERVKISSTWGSWISTKGNLEIATSTTASSTAAKTATLNNFSLTGRISFFLTFTNANTADSPTLNINGTGAKPFCDEMGNIASSTFPFYFPSNCQIEFIYDAVGDQYVYINRIVKSNANDTSQYTVTTNGKKEIQFSLSVSASSSSDYTLPVAMKDTKYICIGTHTELGTGGQSESYVKPIDTSTVRVGNACGNAQTFKVLVKGF